MVVLLGLSALLFLGTVGYLIKNAAAVAELFGKSRRSAEPGELIDGPVRARRASRGAILTALTLHVLGIVGLITSAAIMTGAMASRHPDGLPADMNPVAAEGNS